MSDNQLSVAESDDAILGPQPTAANAELPPPPTLVTEAPATVLITEHEVMLGTAAAVSPRSIPITRRMVGALRVAVTGLRLPPPRAHYPHDAAYIERARMAREMERL